MGRRARRKARADRGSDGGRRGVIKRELHGLLDLLTCDLLWDFVPRNS